MSELFNGHIFIVLASILIFVYFPAIHKREKYAARNEEEGSTRAAESARKESARKVNVTCESCKCSHTHAHQYLA